MTTPTIDLMMNIIRIALSEIRAGNKVLQMTYTLLCNMDA